MSDSVKNAAQGIIDVRFTPSVSELRVLARFGPDRPFHAILTIFSRMGAFALAAGVTGGILWALNVFSQDFLEGLALTIAGGLAGIMAFRMLVESMWRERIRRSLLDSSRRLHITSDGQAMTLQDEHARTWIAFSGIDRLIQSSTHLVLYRNRNSVLALPKAAFDKPEIFDAFASFLHGLMAARDQNKLISEKTP